MMASLEMLEASVFVLGIGIAIVSGICIYRDWRQRRA